MRNSTSVNLSQFKLELSVLHRAYWTKNCVATLMHVYQINRVQWQHRKCVFLLFGVISSPCPNLDSSMTTVTPVISYRAGSPLLA